MKQIVLAFLALLAMAAPVAAVTIKDCGDDAATASAVNIAEPWEKNTRTFYKGQVRVALLDTGGEPVCCSMHLMILSPAGGQDEPEYQACHLINDHEGMGFVAIDFDKLAAAYDPKTGLLISVPYHLYNNEGGPQKGGTAKIRVNTANGTLTVEK
jgi:hypothetical protein